MGSFILPRRPGYGRRLFNWSRRDDAECPLIFTKFVHGSLHTLRVSSIRDQERILEKTVELDVADLAEFNGRMAGVNENSGYFLFLPSS